MDLFLQENHFLADGVCQMVSSKVSEEKMPFLTCTKVLWGVARPSPFLRKLCHSRVMQIVVIINVSM